MEIESLQAWHESLTASPKDVGSVMHCVLRPKKGERDLPEALEMSPEHGIQGDRWADKDEANPKAQVSLMNIHLAHSCAGSKDVAQLSLTGDNLLVDLDLTTDNLPTGTILEIGTAVLVATDQPHRPCHQFTDRFGKDATTRIGWSVKEGYRGRGLLCQIQQAGRISVGDSIRVKRV